MFIQLTRIADRGPSRDEAPGWLPRRTRRRARTGGGGQPGGRGWGGGLDRARGREWLGRRGVALPELDVAAPGELRPAGVGEVVAGAFVVTELQPAEAVVV